MKKLVVVRTLDVGSDILLSRPTEEECSAIKEALTFDNPSYLSAKKYSKYSRVRIPQFLHYYVYDRKTRSIHVPIGFDYESFYDCRHIKVTDHRTLGVPVDQVPPFTFDLREDQKIALDNYIAKNKRVHPNGLIQLPTGKGKSILGLAIAHHYKLKTLILVHKDDLVVGWKKDIEQVFKGKVSAGLIKAKSRVVGNFLTIATVQTLSRMKEEELSKYLSMFGLIITDECQHIGSTTFNIISKFNARYKLGLTATPERSDGLTHLLNIYLGGFAFIYEKRDNEKDILPVEVIRREVGLYFDPVYKRTEWTETHVTYDLVDYFAQKDAPLQKDCMRLSSIFYKERPKVQFSTIEDWVMRTKEMKTLVKDDVVREVKQGHSCVMFFTQKEHCYMYQEFLSNYIDPKTIQLFNGDTKNTEEVLANAESKKCLVTITTLAKGTEGTNVKSWEVAFLVSSMNNAKNVEQACGRIRRVKEGKMKTARVYDYRNASVYSMGSHASTRDQRYRQLGFTDPNTVKKGKSARLFGRGF